MVSKIFKLCKSFLKRVIFGLGFHYTFPIWLVYSSRYFCARDFNLGPRWCLLTFDLQNLHFSLSFFALLNLSSISLELSYPREQRQWDLFVPAHHAYWHPLVTSSAPPFPPEPMPPQSTLSPNLVKPCLLPSNLHPRKVQFLKHNNHLKRNSRHFTSTVGLRTLRPWNRKCSHIFWI